MGIKVKSVVERFEEIKEFVPESMLFHLVIEPKRPPEKSKGGIILTKETNDADKATNQVGQILHIGSLAYQTETPGLDYKKEKVKLKVGDWVFYSRHSGQEIVFVREPGQAEERIENRIELVVLTDTDVLLKLTPFQVEHLAGWSS